MVLRSAGWLSSRSNFIDACRLLIHILDTLYDAVTERERDSSIEEGGIMAIGFIEFGKKHGAENMRSRA